MPTKLTQAHFQARAQMLIGYFNQRTGKQSAEGWITGRDIATDWLDILTAGTPSIGRIESLINRALIFSKSDTIGAIDLYVHISTWQKWLANQSQDT